MRTLSYDLFTNLLKRFPCAFLLSLALIGSTSAQAQISSRDAVKTLEAFFSALSVEAYGNGDLEALVTDDFVIFEMGQRFTLSEFKAFLASANYADWHATDWVISNYTVTSDQSSAHIFYQNDGVFLFADQDKSDALRQQTNLWLESALVVKDGDTLKLKFLQSENVSRIETAANRVD